jgi:hypothetical protein
MKRVMLNVVAIVVIGIGARDLTAQDSYLQPCCVATITRVSCCGDTCEAGWFQCSAAIN